MTSTLTVHSYSFYRAMHYSPKRGIAIACRLSVRLSITLVDQDHAGWQCWKLIAGIISATASLFVAQTPSTYSQGNTGKFWGDWRWGEKGGALEHKSGNISETRKDRGKVTMYGYRNSPTLFRMVPPPTPYGLPFPKIGVRTPPKTPIAIISGTGKATNFKFGQNNNRVCKDGSTVTLILYGYYE